MKTILALIVMSFFLSTNINAQTGLSLSGTYKPQLQYVDRHHYNIFFVDQPDNNASHNHSVINLSGQAVVGSALAVGFSFLPLAAMYANAGGNSRSNNHSDFPQVALGVLTISSYMFGAAVGVHWIAKSENPNLSFWGTVGYSAIGGGAGILLTAILASKYTTIPGVGGFFIAVSPVLGAMVYASFIADWPRENQTTVFIQKSISHKDLIEQSKLFNIEVLRIEL